MPSIRIFSRSFSIIKSRLIYVSRIDDLPPGARYVLIQPEREREVMESSKWAPSRAQQIERITDYRKRTVILMKIGEGNP